MAGSVKWFRVATEGATTDGRKVARDTIVLMAKNFDPKKYGARVWMEHIRGMMPDSAFRALGDVTALKSEVVEGKMCLFAQISPTADLVKMSQDRQKIYTSIEIDPNFADSGEPYLVGLGVTDSPAALGTDILQFNTSGGGSALAHRKQRKENEFSAGEESDIKFSADNDDPSTGFLDKIKSLIGNFSQQTDKNVAAVERVSAEKFAAISTSVTLIAEEVGALKTRFAAIEKGGDKAASEKTQKDLDALTKQFNDLRAELDKTADPSKTRRPAATGTGDRVATDC